MLSRNRGGRDVKSKSGASWGFSCWHFAVEGFRSHLLQRVFSSALAPSSDIRFSVRNSQRFHSLESRKEQLGWWIVAILIVSFFFVLSKDSDMVEVGHCVPEKSYDRPKLPDSSPGFEGFDPGGFCPAGEFPKLSLGLIRVWGVLGSSYCFVFLAVWVYYSISPKIS